MYHQLQEIKCVVVRQTSATVYSVRVLGTDDEGMLICAEQLADGDELTCTVGDERAPLILCISREERRRLRSRRGNQPEKPI